MKRHSRLLLGSLGLVLGFSLAPQADAEEKLKALIMDGQNNHAVWPKSTIMMRQYLLDSGLFEVEIARTGNVWRSEREAEYLPLAGVGEKEQVQGPRTDPDFEPDFEKYDVVVNNLGYKAAPLPEETEKALEEYMKNGGGLVIVHAANNCWPEWEEYNRMIGIGGWGGRDEDSGPYVYLDEEGEVVRDASPGKGGAHGPKHEYVVTMHDLDHPITKGLPKEWMHSKDECYSHLRGPGENMTVLATGQDIPKLVQAGRNEPLLMVLDYHEGRVFHNCLGDDTPAFEGVGFITTFLRGAEWAATGKVTQEIPEDFPTKEKSSSRTFSAAELDHQGAKLP